MKTAPWIVLLVALIPSSSYGQLAVEADARGVVGVRVGDAAYLSDLAVSVVKPGWSGDLANQRAVDPAKVKVHKAGATTTYTMPLSGALSGVLIERIIRERDGATLEFELIPDRDVELEAVVLRGSLATAEHAGKTTYLVGDQSGERGVLPAALNADRYVAWSGRPEWLGLERPGAGGLRIAPRDVQMQLQDDRKFDSPLFSLLMTTSGGEVLARKPIRFGVSLRAEAAGALDKEARKVGVLAQGDARPLAVASARLDRERVDVFATVTLDADVHARYDNPFDPGQVAVDAEVAAPDGRKVNVPGYYHIPFRVETRNGAETLKAAGAAGFRVRYAPTIAGPHTVTLKVKDASGEVRSEALTFLAVASKSPGFVRVAAKSPRYFAFDDGSPYFAIGENVCWANARNPLASYENWFGALGKAGGNWARLWLAFNEKGLEWSPNPTPKAGTGSYQGLGRYALDNAWRLDEVLRIAETHGVRLMYCIGTYGEFKVGGYFNEGSWVSNPYNARNGGPCSKPEDFWTDATARKLYKQRLRYLVARWGHSPFVFAWEFWNEVEPTPAVEAWTREMAAYLSEIDPNRRLVSTSYGTPPIWNDRNVDFTMTHMYGQAGDVLDFTAKIRREAVANLKFGKPYLLAEFGIDWQTGDQKWDPQGHGLNMHNGAWASVASGAAGTAMLWYWDSYVHPRDVYHVLTPVRKFADAIDWTKNPMKPIEAIAVAAPPGGVETFQDLTLVATEGWGRSPGNHYQALQDGTVQGGPIAQTLGSPKRGGDGKELYSEVVWTLDMPKPGKVLVRIGDVCSGARLRIAVDGREAVNRPLPAGEPGKGPWKSARLLQPYKVWVASYDEEVAVEVPAGRHELAIANLEGDWMQVRSITLPAYRSSRFPDVDALGIAGDDLMVLWVHDRRSTWRDPYDGTSPAPRAGLTLKVPTASTDAWSVEWWDTFQGLVVRTDVVRPASGTLPLAPPEFVRDLAARLVRKP
ncbi:DUF5060 domain-containing protein [Paludisphaera mucosa]|uniref:DUF5060 domain-containing protein n=1 Tax=Paludisphaera mucosa TaxID=3030827 RepID=A0ABT6FEV7_9BACT|nr:DUF5060 domain-containing protein [Paludisphaera mucosa]MDG3006106.1 DUF5060 domain-containing protein [Paludisphaera mucosa]